MIESLALHETAAPATPLPARPVSPQTDSHFEALLANAEVPWGSAIASAWEAAASHQRTMRTRLVERLEAGCQQPWSLREMAALQHEVASITFQQEVVTQLAKKATDCVVTLIKNG